MQEIAALADEIVIIAHGRLAAQGTPDRLREEFQQSDLEQIFVDAVVRAGEPGGATRAAGGGAR
jgi:sodium transport system ATP-binding protein